MTGKTHGVYYFVVHVGYCGKKYTICFILLCNYVGKKHCDDDVLEYLISTNSGQPFQHLQTLQGRYLGNFTYVVTNSSAQSLVKIGVSKHSSILFSLYPGATLKEGSLKGNISHNSTHWNLNVTGEVESCPGKIYVSCVSLCGSQS